jgi:hypothetical protein
MKSLDALYIQLNKHILLAQSYSEIPELFFIIKGCRLKPYEVIFEGSKKLVLHRWWIDEFGNSLKITKNKKIEIKYGDLSFDRERIICTDLYYGLSLDKITKMSKLVYICAGADEDIHQESYFLTFLGIDNYLRSYMYLYEEWQIVSPLLLGTKNLRLLGRNSDIKYFKHFSNSKTLPIHCVSSESYLSSLPISTEFRSVIAKKYDKLLEIL